MSVLPIPVHISCFGVSADAVTMARGYSKHSYSERLASVKTAMQAVPAEPASVPTSNTTSDAPVLVPAAPWTARQAPDVKLRPVGTTDQATHQLVVSTPSSSGAGPPASATALNASSMLNYRAHTKHNKIPTPPLQALDFISIAVNSVGGGGVPRPYGKFQACRCGDGNATWERLPPQPGSWQARALPVAVTLLGDKHTAHAPSGSGSGTVTGSPADTAARPPPVVAPKPTSRNHMPHPSNGVRRVTEPPAGIKDSTSGDISELRLGFGSFGWGGPRRSQTTPTPRVPSPASSQSAYSGGASSGRAVSGGNCSPPPGNSSGGWGPMSPRQVLHEQSYYRRPGSTAHRWLVPLPPPEPQHAAAWFALPAATFLTEVPAVPEHLRMDNGYSVSREFLMSGLNPPKAPSPAPPGSPSHVMSPTTSQAPAQQPLSPQQRQPSSERRASGFHPPHPEARVEDKRVLWEALEQGGQVATHGGSGLTSPGFRPSMIRGVYVPIERMCESGEQSLPSRAAIQLPAEHTLPRRNVPPGW